MSYKTSLYDKHLLAGAKIVDFAGWQMPLHYGSQVEEHNQVRRDAGMFDVSHMTVVDIIGEQAHDFLRYLLANDVSKLKTIGAALYSCMLNPQGGVVDDLIVYKLAEDRYRMVVNAATREKDIAWIKDHCQPFPVKIKMRTDLGIIAVQGPQAITKALPTFKQDWQPAIAKLRPFQCVEFGDWQIARTGYTGEDGFEIILPLTGIAAFWDQLLAAEIKPCGLGARDTLRLEAGLNLYGVDMNETTTPLESNLAWTVALDSTGRNFIGREALEKQKTHLTKKLVGLIMEQRGVLRNHQKIIMPDGLEGEITSGSFSPTLQQAIAFARVPITADKECFVDIRGQRMPLRIVKPPFVRHGQKVYDL